MENNSLNYQAYLLADKQEIPIQVRLNTRYSVLVQFNNGYA